ncbi:MAG: hypothetical protein NWE84_09170 [Candidatus Bathyarchaeota archaeon]|nr:hypothetical protein [Candidatus Bathyarchaeota archaeon]
MTRNLLASMAKASILKHQALWYASSIAVYTWFLYWVAYDFFVWQKPIAEINAVNYVGAIAAITLIWAGTRIFKLDRIKATSPQQKLMPEEPKQPLPPSKTPPVASPSISACAHYLGYLNHRQKSKEIPAQCLTCEQVITCMGSTN